VNTQIDDTGFGAIYDAAGRLKTVTYENGHFDVSYTYDERDLLIKVEDSLTGTQMNFSYDEDGRLVEIQRSNGIDTAYSWDAANQITRIQDQGIADQQYKLDSIGNVTEIVLDLPLHPAGILKPKNDSFNYDAASQVNSPGYTYDESGRRTTSPENTFEWDGTGRLIRYGTTEMTYNGLGDLSSRTRNENVINYYYNYALELQPIVAEQNDETLNFERFYVWAPDGSLLYAIDPSNDNAVYFYHFDRTGSTLFLTESTGAVTDSYAYSPYGLLLDHLGNIEQPFTFVGQFGVRQEGEAGLYHMRARYYDAVSGSFISRDPLWPNIISPFEINPYNYAGCNPATLIDPMGTEWLLPLPDTVVGGIPWMSLFGSVLDRSDREASQRDDNRSLIPGEQRKAYDDINDVRKKLHLLNIVPSLLGGSWVNRKLMLTQGSYKTIWWVNTNVLKISKAQSARTAVKIFGVASKVNVPVTLAEGAVSWAQVWKHFQLTPAEVSKQVGDHSKLTWSDDPFTKAAHLAGYEGYEVGEKIYEGGAKIYDNAKDLYDKINIFDW